MENKEEEFVKEASSKSLKAKDASLWGQILAALFITGFGSFYIIKNIMTLNPLTIIWFGLAIGACFSPVYFNLIIEKLTNKDR